MSEDLIIRHCAPTLAGLKTGNIFNASYDSEDELEESLAAWNQILERRGLRVTCLRTTAGRALIYVYRPHFLEKDLTGPLASEMLEQFGYVPNDPESCIRHLASRMIPGGGFPHEIGLFLGYPPEDVRGFIRQGGKNCKACGYWKVYGDKEAAEKRFAQFSKCTGVYLRCMEYGAGLEKLAVRKS